MFFFREKNTSHISSLHTTERSLPKWPLVMLKINFHAILKRVRHFRTIWFELSKLLQIFHSNRLNRFLPFSQLPLIFRIVSWHTYRIKHGCYLDTVTHFPAWALRTINMGSEGARSGAPAIGLVITQTIHFHRLKSQVFEKNQFCENNVKPGLKPVSCDAKAF